MITTIALPRNLRENFHLHKMQSRISEAHSLVDRMSPDAKRRLRSILSAHIRPARRRRLIAESDLPLTALAVAHSFEALAADIRRAA